MSKSELKLNQIVSDAEVKQKYWSQKHKLNNSLKRGTSHASPSPSKQHNYCKNRKTQMIVRLPQVGFDHKDLSLIIRYVLLKQEMKPSDRNLIRRIMISNFDEETIIAGSKKFVQFLKLEQGYGTLNTRGKNSFYFLLKGRGIVTSGDFQYEVKKGDVFGQIQFICGTEMKSIEFQSSYLMLVLDKNNFNLFFREYFKQKYEEKQTQINCIHELYLQKIPTMAKFLLLRNIQYKIFSPGEIIVSKNQRVKHIYFVASYDTPKQKQSRNGCLGLFQIINSKKTYLQTVLCEQKRLKLPFLSPEAVQTYILDILGSETIDKQSVNELNKSCLSLNIIQIPIVRPKLISFMRKKKVKLVLAGSRIKTEPNEYFEANFSFLKSEKVNSSFHQRKTEQKRVGTSLSRIFNSSASSKKKKTFLI